MWPPQGIHWGLLAAWVYLCTLSPCMTAQVMAKQLDPLVDMCVKGLTDSHPKVRWAACQALGQMCTDLGPEMQVCGSASTVFLYCCTAVLPFLPACVLLFAGADGAHGRLEQPQGPSEAALLCVRACGSYAMHVWR